MTESARSTELVITRIFDAPPELVFRAFVEPDEFAAWFGPVGWSVPRDTVTIDARVGGRQRFVMVDDTDPSRTSPADGTFSEVVPGELLVGHEDVVDPDLGPVRLQLRLEFHDEGGGKTRLVLRQGPFLPAIESAAREGWGSSFTKLDALLAR